MRIVDMTLLDDRLPVYVLVLAGVFSAAMAYAAVAAELPAPLEEFVSSSEERLAGLAELNPVILPAAIFVNNVVVALISAATSLTVVAPMVIIALNGVLVGSVLKAAYLVPELESVNAALIHFMLAPHGSLEIPAIAVASSAGLYVIDFSRRFRAPLRSVIKRNVYLSVLLLLVAAIAEVTVTPVLAIIVLLGLILGG